MMMRPASTHTLEQQLRAAIDRGDEHTIDLLGRRLDRAEQETRRPAPQLLASALWYAQQGLHVFPLQAGSKIPHKKTRGCLDATTDPAQIRRWWAIRPDSNVAIATGHLVDVIDIDGPTGVQSWARMTNLPPILGTVSTPRDGGNHLYVAATGDGNNAGIFPGVDYRGKGGYVVAPPSVNSDGVAYTWRRPLDLAPAAAAGGAA